MRQSHRRGESRWHPWLVAAWLAALLAVTLPPAPVIGPSEALTVSPCIICGSRGLSDAILNVALFVPLGLVIGRRLGAIGTLLVAAVLSISVEIVQLAIPGRYSTLGDVLWNATGAGVGVLLLMTFHNVMWAHGTSHRRASHMVVVVLVGTVLGAGILLEPAPTRELYWGQWTPDLAGMTRYRGNLLRATVNDVPLPDGPIGSGIGWETMSGSWTLEAVVELGPPPAGLSPLAAIYDDQEREILLLGAVGEDLVLRERTRARGLRLDQPDLRLFGAFGMSEVGDTVHIAISRVGDRRCVFVDGNERCHLAFSPGRVWGLLLYPDGLGVVALRTLDVAWLVILFLPLGLLGTSPRSAVALGALALAAVVGATAVTRLTMSPGWEVAAACLGVAVGSWLASRFRVASTRSVRCPPTEPSHASPPT